MSEFKQSQELAIDVQGLVKRFGRKTAVDGIDIQQPIGKVWGFLGPNGSGKTTTIRLLCGLLKATAGQGHCLGFDFRTDTEAIKRHTGYMTQRFSFWTDMTIRENLEFVARLYRLPRFRQTVDETIEQLDLSARQHQLTEALSGGWKQRLALAAVTMHRPNLLLLDEPTAGVDPQARREFWDQIHHLSSDGMTVLVSTHYMDEAERCDHIVYLANGRKITEGRVPDIIAESGLCTYRIEGPGVRALAQQLEGRRGLDHVAYFGAALHVSGPAAEPIEDALRSLADSHFSWSVVRPSLEDAFIELMARAGADTRLHSE